MSDVTRLLEAAIQVDCLHQNWRSHHPLFRSPLARDIARGRDGGAWLRRFGDPRGLMELVQSLPVEMVGGGYGRWWDVFL